VRVLVDEGRLRIAGGEPPDVLGAFAEDVRAGLTSEPKRLSCRYFYDAEGSRLFEAICELPEYYLTRTEAGILEQRAAELAARFDEPPTLVELGSGSAVKTRLLLRALLERHGSLCYRPIDVALGALEESARALLADFPGLEVDGLSAEYAAGLAALAQQRSGRDRDGASAFLAGVRRTLDARDRMLVGIDHRKERAVLEAAYDDASGVTARFNQNLLVRINRELGGDFDVERFAHRARYDEDVGRIEMYLVSEEDARVRIGALDLDLRFGAGEAVHTENSTKYSAAEIDALVAAAGFSTEARWTDEQDRFSVSLLGPVSGDRG
jgi:dimethylhistidine N-methyltransferase